MRVGYFYSRLRAIHVPLSSAIYSELGSVIVLGARRLAAAQAAQQFYLNLFM